MIIETALREGFSESYEVVDRLKIMLMLAMETLGQYGSGATASTVYCHEDGYKLESPKKQGKCEACGGRSLGVLYYRKRWICPDCKRAWLQKNKFCGKIKSWESFVSGRI